MLPPAIKQEIILFPCKIRENTLYNDVVTCGTIKDVALWTEEWQQVMVDISPAGSAAPQAQNLNTSARPPERVESERRAAADSDVERLDTERAENRAQDRAQFQAAADNRRDRPPARSDGQGQRVDILV